MTLSRLAERIQKSLLLPHGHQERKNAEQAYHDFVEAEYAECRKIEDEWQKKHKKFRNLGNAMDVGCAQEARLIVGFLEKQFKIPGLKGEKLIFQSPEVKRYYGYGAIAHYNNGRIHFRYSADLTRYTVLIHEFTHHACAMEPKPYNGHGELFCKMLQLMFAGLDLYIQHERNRYEFR
jgi:hypothetical protein